MNYSPNKFYNTCLLDLLTNVGKPEKDLPRTTTLAYFDGKKFLYQVTLDVSKRLETVFQILLTLEKQL
jgi:hypothetical protein